MTAPNFAKEARDLAANPYSADEQRVADYLAEVAFGGGDDPIGYIITAHRWMRLVSIPNAKEAGEAAGRLAGRAEAAATLREHWLTGVHCDHEAKTDVATCYCSVWRSEPQASVGAAVERWIEHVQAILSASTTPDPPAEESDRG